MAAGFMNTLITASNKEKIWMPVGPKFGKGKGWKVTVVRSLLA